MATDGTGARVFQALPGRTESRREAFARCLTDLARILGLDVPPAPDSAGRHEWERDVRTAWRETCLRGVRLSEEAFDALIETAVHDPDPSFNRQFVEPAVNAFGQRRVQAALLGRLRTGTDPERAGAARAWYWSAVLSSRMPRVRAADPDAAGRAEPDEGTDLPAAWHETALREFVRNEHLDVRRCILPLLPLRKSAYPPELHDLVDTAVTTARAHPDAYIRHRVEHQVGD